VRVFAEALRLRKERRMQMTDTQNDTLQAAKAQVSA
jgi:hypothetical protein